MTDKNLFSNAMQRIANKKVFTKDKIFIYEDKDKVQVICSIFNLGKIYINFYFEQGKFSDFSISVIKI